MAKSRIKQMSGLFCQYLRNGSSDLYEILCGSQLLPHETNLLEVSFCLLDSDILTFYIYISVSEALIFMKFKT